MKMLPEFYQIHLQSQLTRTQFLVLQLLIAVLQSKKQVRLEQLATAFPCPIKFDSRRRKLQRFLTLPQLKIETIWFGIVTYWLKTYLKPTSVLHVAIDRTQWGCINLLMVSLIWDKRALPVYWELLPKLGSSNLEEQKAALKRALPVFKGYKVVVLGDREFCDSSFGKLAQERGRVLLLTFEKIRVYSKRKRKLAAPRFLGVIPRSLPVPARSKSYQN